MFWCGVVGVEMVHSRHRHLRTIEEAYANPLVGHPHSAGGT